MAVSRPHEAQPSEGPSSTSSSLPSSPRHSTPVVTAASGVVASSRLSHLPEGVLARVQLTQQQRLVSSTQFKSFSPGKPSPIHVSSAPAVPRLRAKQLSLAEKRGQVQGSQIRFKLSDINNGPDGQSPGAQPNGGSEIDQYKQFLDKESGRLRLGGHAVLTNKGVTFGDGQSFDMSLEDVDTQDELGKGNYGTVYKVRHARPQMRRPGLGLAGNKTRSLPAVCDSPPVRTDESTDGTSPTMAKPSAGPTGRVMAMKEIRLELDETKFNAIDMELTILHRCKSPFIVDFYGAFFQEGAVYICMEFMDGGSIDKLYGDGIPENVLKKITLATVLGLKSLKDEHNIIHRDVKPTNILINTRGQVKICDFGVSGNLVASIAKTNIGCQSYMAPERISSGGIAQTGAGSAAGTYSVQSDIWSLGLTIIECAMGRYPYPPDTYNNIFSQLSAIVDGEPPDLPPKDFSTAAQEFVGACLKKVPSLRPSYDKLLKSEWLASLLRPVTIAEEADEEEAAKSQPGNASADGASTDYTSVSAPEDPDVARWVVEAVQRKRDGTLAQSKKPALHAARLDAVASPGGTPSATMQAPAPPATTEE